MIRPASPAPEPTDEALMARVASGDRAAFDALFFRWKGPIWGFLLRRLGAASLADDAFQDTWARVWRFRDRFDPARRFRPWLYTLASNAGHDQWARPVPADFDGLGATTGGPDQKLAVLEALFALEGADRTVILLVAEGFEPTEIAEMLGQEPNAVRARLSRARQKIRERA